MLLVIHVKKDIHEILPEPFYTIEWIESQRNNIQVYDLTLN